MSAEVLALPKPARPRASELELRALGALLASGAAQVSLRPLLDGSGLSATELRDPRVRTAWAILRKLAEKGRPVSAATVWSAGRSARVLSEADAAWLEELQLASIVTAQELPSLLEDLRRLGRDESLLAALSGVAAMVREGGYRPADAMAALRTAATLLLEPTGDVTAMSSLVALLDARDKHQREGTRTLVSTGLSALDELIGGLPHSLTFLFGNPGAGKTGIEASMVRGQLEGDPDMRVGVMGLEDGIDWLSRRWLAEESGMLLRDVAWKSATADEQARIDEASPRLAPLLDRVLVYSARKVRPAEVLRIATGWARRHAIKALFIDNASQLRLEPADPKARSEYWQLVADSYEDLRAFGEDYGVAVVLLAHTTAPDGERSRRPKPPHPSEVRGGLAAEQKARVMLGAWSKNDAWRITIGKANESPNRGATLELDRIPHAGLVHRHGGALVDLRAEEAIERRMRQAEKERELEAARDARAARKKATKAEKAEEKPPEVPQKALDLGGAS